MADEITKTLIKSDSFLLTVKRENDRIRIMSNSMDVIGLTLRPDEYLTIQQVDGTITVTRRPLMPSMTEALAPIVTEEKPPWD